MTPAEMRSAWPVFTGHMEGWKILSSPAAGWATAGKILLEMATISASRGVQFLSGAFGHARSLVFDETNSCVGVSTVDGTVYFADQIILAAGANTESLLDMDGQLSAVGTTVCFVQLTSEEAKLYKNMVLFANIEEGLAS